MFQQILNLVTDPTTLSLLGGGLSVSVITQAIKHWVGLQNAKVIVFLTGTISVLLVGATYLLYFAGSNPNALGKNTAVIFSVATFAYRFLIEPAYSILIDAKNFRSNATASKVNDAAVAAINASSTIENDTKGGITTIGSAEKVAADILTAEKDVVTTPVTSSDEFAG